MADGAYHHDSVPKYLEELLEVPEGQIHHAWDHMHKSALEDGHIAKIAEFDWVAETVNTVTEGVRMFRVGKKYFLLQQICDRLDIRLVHLATLPETRMANYKRVVLKNFDADIQPIIIGLEEIQLEKAGGNSKEREEAEAAAAFRAKIFNKKFVLRLTGTSYFINILIFFINVFIALGLCDVYDVYGNICNILQKVDTLPYEKYDIFTKLLEKLRDMVKTIKLSDCPGCAEPESSTSPESDHDDPTTLPDFANGEDSFSSGDNFSPAGPSSPPSSLSPTPLSNSPTLCQLMDQRVSPSVSSSSETDDPSSSDSEDSDEDEDTEDVIERILNMGEDDGEEETKACKWNKYHQCLKELKSNKYHGLSFMDDVEPLHETIFDKTRTQQEKNKRRRMGDVFEKTEDQLIAFSKKLVTSLEENTYSPEDKQVIDKSRTLTDFYDFKEKMKIQGPVFYAAETFPKYIAAVRSLPIASVDKISDDEIRVQFKIFCHSLHGVELKQDDDKDKKTEKKERRKRNSKKKNKTVEKSPKLPKKKDSKELIKHFLSTKNNLFTNIELIMHITTYSAVSLSTESVLESNVSVFERHFHKGRPVKELTMKLEMEVAMNGPILVEADDVINLAMTKYWGSKRWHFIKRRDIGDYLKESLVLKRLKKAKSKLPFPK